MYQYSRAIYRSIKDMIDPYGDRESQLESRRAVLTACEQTMERLANDPLYFAKPDRALFQDIRRHFPITCQAEVAWAVQQGVSAAAQFIEDQIEAGALDGGVARCRATTRKGKPCQRTPLPDRDYCPALQTALYLLEGKFAYAEPLRLALQNLALGRPGFADARSDTALRVEVLDPDYSPEMPGRLAKLDGAISMQRTVKFEYWSISRDHESERTLNPYALMPDNGIWYVVGYDLDRDDIRTFRVSRIRGDIKFATRRERDFRVPADFDIEQFRGRPP